MAKAATPVKGTSMANLLAEFQKDMGEKVGSFGGKLLDQERVPTGLFQFDLATGGGFPRGMCSIVYGPESSGKTNLILKAIANHQKLWPDQVCAFIALEGFDKAWAKMLGVDVDKLLVMYPSFAEQVVDMAESMLYAEDCGIVAIDSLAVMMTTAESEKSAGDAIVGGNGLIIGRLCRRTTLALNEAAKAGRSPTLIYINQTRKKIGVMYGDPTTMPGGDAPRFQAQLWVKVWGKNIMDAKVHPDLAVFKETQFQIQKNKVPILAVKGVYQMVCVPHSGLKVGETDDFATIMDRLKGWGLVTQEKTGWRIMADLYPTQKAFKERLYTDKAFARDMKKALAERVLAEHTAFIIQEEEGQVVTVDADGVVQEG